MLSTTYTFQYNPENLHTFSYVFSTDAVYIPLIILGSIVLYGIIYLLAPYVFSFFLDREQKQIKEEKRNVIKNLILMKEVQGELEKEIEQSLLNITLQSKGA